MDSYDKSYLDIDELANTSNELLVILATTILIVSLPISILE